MANRNENLKKINDELEKLTDEELEQVAGGNRDELRELVKALHDNKRIGFDEGEYLFGSDARWQDIATKKLDKLGINAKIYYSNFLDIGNDADTYTDKATGKSLTHAQVIDIIKNYKG